MQLKNIEFLINSGQGNVDLGQLGSHRCVASACDLDQCLVMLVRREGETLVQLLQRLDAAIEDACENDVFIDETNQ